MLAYRSADANQCFLMFQAWNVRQRRLFQNCQSFKIQFWVKTTSLWHRSRDVNDVQRQSRFAQKGGESWAYGLKPKHYQPNSSVQKSQDRKKPIKFGQIRWFCSLFSSIAMAWCMEYYLEVMSRLREAICQKRTELWKNQLWILHHDNAPANTSMLMREFLAKNKTVIMPLPPYTSDLVFPDFFLRPKLKTPMKGKRFATIDSKKRVSEVFRGLKKKTLV